LHLPKQLGSQLEQGDWADLGTVVSDRAGTADAFAAARFTPLIVAVASAIALANAQQLGFADRIHFLSGFLVEPLESPK